MTLIQETLSSPTRPDC